MPKLYFVIFIVIVLSVYGAMHWFIYQRIASGLVFSPGQRLALKLFLLAGGLSFFLAEFLSRRKPVHLLRFSRLGLAGDHRHRPGGFRARSPALAAAPGQPPDPGPGVLGGHFPGLGRLHFQWPALSRGPAQSKSRSRNLPAKLAGLTIVHLSDLHLGNLTSIDRLRWIVARVNELNPDLICVTGDILDGDVCRSEEYCALLLELKARHGVVAVTGNHEFYAGIDLFTELARRSRWRILRNETWSLDGQLDIIGLDDDAGKSFKFRGPDLDGGSAFGDRERSQGPSLPPPGRLRQGRAPGDRPAALGAYPRRADPAHGFSGLADL